MNYFCDSENSTSTNASTAGDTLTAEKIMETMRMLEDIPPLPRIMFSPLVEIGQFLTGDFVERMLNCRKGGKGFVAHPSMRPLLDAEGVRYEEVTAGQITLEPSKEFYHRFSWNIEKGMGE